MFLSLQHLQQIWMIIYSLWSFCSRKCLSASLYFNAEHGEGIIGWRVFSREVGQRELEGEMQQQAAGIHI